MAQIFESKDRNVLPNWRSFENTLKLGEVNGLVKKDLSNFFVPDLTILNSEWDADRNIGIAAELVNIGSTFNIKNDVIVEAIEFILGNKNMASRALINSANDIKFPNLNKNGVLEITSIDKFTEIDNLQIIYNKINELKHKLFNNPRNPIHWIDISRYYSMIGQNVKARVAIMNSLYLSNDNRFILRSVVRFFVHNGELELAHDLLRKRNIIKFDPWLTAAEISLASMRGRASRFVKIGISLTESNNLSPFDLSELSSALGTIEMMNGNHKKSRIFFNRSLIDPNDNALAQAEWASQQNNIISLTGSSINSNPNSFEALAREFFEKKKWELAVENCIKWFLDIPFSKSPIELATHILRTHLKDHKKAIELSKVGLISHPNDPILTNNIIYSLCIENRLDEARELLEKSEPIFKTEKEKTFFNATKGLYYFRMKDYQQGRFYYNLAIDNTSSGNKLLNKLAFVNYTREEINIDSDQSKNLINKMEILTKGETDDGLLTTKEEAISLFKKKALRQFH